MLNPLEVFCCCACEDQEMLTALLTHLTPLQRKGSIRVWSETNLHAGAEREKELRQHLEHAAFLLLLISPDFLASDSCYGMMQQAIWRHDEGSADVILALLRPSLLPDIPPGKCSVVPTNGQPVTTWRNRDQAFHDIALYIEKRVVQTPLVSRRQLVLGAAGAATITAGTAIFAILHAHSAAPQLAATRASSPGTTRPPTVPDPEHPFIYRGHAGSRVRGVAWSPRGDRIASASFDHTVQLWNASDGGNPLTCRGSGWIYAVAWSLDGRQFISGSGDYQGVSLWNANGSGPLKIYGDPPSMRQIFAVSWSPDGRSIAAGEQAHIYVWRVRSPGDPPLLTYQNTSNQPQVNGISWSHDSKRIASANENATVQVWDTTRSGGNPLTYNGHTAEIWGVSWSPDGLSIASASADQTVRVWDASSVDKPPRVLQSQSGAVYAVAWSPDSTWLASAHDDGTVRVWNANPADNAPRVYQRHDKGTAVYAVTWRPDSTWLASAGEDTTVRVWPDTVGHSS